MRTTARRWLAIIGVASIVAACASERRIYGDAPNDANAAQDATAQVDAALDAANELAPDAGPDSSLGAPTIVTEICSLDAGIESNQVWVRHAFPGKTIADLAMVRAVIHFVDGGAYGPNGYSHVGAVPYLRDGEVALACGNATGMYFDSVTFILP